MKPEHEPNSVQKAGHDPAISRKDSPHGLKLTEILDVLAKLIGASAVVFVAVIGHQYQSSMTATTLLVQREQADSTLRAGMFRDLIGPFLGSGKEKGDLSIEREQLLVELMAVNFHENFQLKPLLMHVDHRLVQEKNGKVDQSQQDDPRESLRSIARRVAQRQLSTITKAEGESLPEQQTCVYELELVGHDDFQLLVPGPQEIAEETSSPQPCSKQNNYFTPARRYFNDLIPLKSPSGRYSLRFTIAGPKSWEDQRFDVSMKIIRSRVDDIHKKQSSDAEGNMEWSDTVADVDFQLTWFDFPFSDNTLLADGTRFALVLDQVDPYLKRVKFKLIWFPLDYYAAQERPTNHRQFRENLGLTVK